MTIVVNGQVVFSSFSDCLVILYCDLLGHYIMHVLYVYKQSLLNLHQHIFSYSLLKTLVFLFMHIKPFQTYTHCNLDSLCSPNSKFM